LSSPTQHDGVYRLHDDAALACFADGALVMRLSDYHLFELNTPAGDILSRLDGNLSLAHIAEALAQEYRQPESRLLNDALALMEQLLEQNLVTQCGPSLPMQERQGYAPGR
jgi:hypothetical protein